MRIAGIVLFSLIIFSSVSTAAETQADAFSKYDIEWVREPTGDIIVRTDLAIDAPASLVWQLVRDPNLYSSFSKALSAHVDVMRSGAPIWLNIQLFDASFPTISLEEVGVFDDEMQAVSWSRDFGFGQVTRRWQIVTSEAGNAHYYTALKFPRELGWLIDRTLRKNIQTAFERFAADLKMAAEKDQLKL